ncbi:hypothetical protein ACOSQ4_007264 [Xanthoceras sorbifolium]
MRSSGATTGRDDRNFITKNKWAVKLLEEATRKERENVREGKRKKKRKKKKRKRERERKKKKKKKRRRRRRREKEEERKKEKEKRREKGKRKNPEKKMSKNGIQVGVHLFLNHFRYVFFIQWVWKHSYGFSYTRNSFSYVVGIVC